MGYTENSCQLCSVSFNIARCRTKYEPRSDGWGYSSQDYYSGGENTRCNALQEQSGCGNVLVNSTPGGIDVEVHLSGRGCTFTGGYNGWVISAIEMKGMQLPRYIIKKPKNATPEPDEADYEKDSEFFITGQTTCPPDDFEPGQLDKIRYGVDWFYAQNYMVTDGMEFGVPVHDACWKIFERISMEKLGHVDMDGFMALWHRQACGNCGFQNMKQVREINACKEQWWNHKSGTEYLGANPYDIPNLLLALQDEYSNGMWESIHVPHGSGRFEKRNPTDIFAKLPTELTNAVLHYLSSKDIANLRLASRSFGQLPRSLFRRLIEDEIPWFWEFEELRAADDEYWKRVYEDDDPAKASKEALNRIQRARDGNYTQHPDWYSVYKRLRLLEKNMLGAKNRARIWKVVEEVVLRIDQWRNEVQEGSSSQIEPTQEEYDRGLTTHNSDCPRCRPSFASFIAKS